MNVSNDPKEKENLKTLWNLVKVYQLHENPDDGYVHKEIQDFVNKKRESEPFKEYKQYFTDGWEKELDGLKPEDRSKWFGNIVFNIDEKLQQV